MSACILPKSKLSSPNRTRLASCATRQIAGRWTTGFGISSRLERDNPEVNAFVASVTAMGRAALPDDIGPMIASLLSDGNRWVTGQRIEASGGMFL